MDLLGALDAATDEFGRRLASVGAQAWASPTPCAEWDVRYLVAHVVGGNRFSALVLGGMSAADAIDQVMSSPQLGRDALAAWATTCAAQASAFAEVLASQRRIDHPLGEISGSEFLRFRVFDVTLHSWDLARAIGASEHLDADLVEVVLDIVESGPPGMGFGIVPLGRAPADAPSQVRLLDLTGRAST